MDSPKLSLFKLTKKIVEEAEIKAISPKIKESWLTKNISRNTIFSLPFLQSGFTQLIQPVIKWYTGTLILMAIFIVIIKVIPIQSEVQYYLILACMYAPMFVVGFAMPSTFAFEFIEDEQVNYLSNYIYNLGFDCKSKLDSLNESINLVAERTYTRISAFQKLIAILSGLFLYVFNQFTTISLKIAHEDIGKIISENIATFICYVFISMFFIVLVISYKKANDTVFRIILSSIQEIKFRVTE
jgi:hypothetical protein